MAFRAYLTVSNQKILSELTMKVAITFMFQVALMVMLNFDYINATGNDMIINSFSMGTASVNASRIVCAFLLHF